jgi:hypothetical protein
MASAHPLPFDVKTYKEEMLTGIPLSGVDTNGNPWTYADTTIERRIRAAVNTFENRLQMDLWQRRVITRAHALYPDLKQGQDYDIDEDPIDYQDRDFFAQGYLKLKRSPIIAINKLEFRFPESTVLVTIDPSWQRIYHQTGQVHILAVAGAAMPVIIGREGGFLPLLTASLQRSGVPQLVYADYVCGVDFQNDAANYGSPAGGDNYEDLRLALMQQTTALVLQDLSRTVPGISSSSLSEDGQSESVSYARGAFGIYSQEIEGLEKAVESFLKEWKARRKGIRFSVL